MLFNDHCVALFQWRMPSSRSCMDMAISLCMAVHGNEVASFFVRMTWRRACLAVVWSLV